MTDRREEHAHVLELGIIAAFLAIAPTGCGGRRADYSTSDFRRFESRYQRFGSAPYQFILERDCSAKNGTGKTASIPVDACNEFKLFAVSNAMVEAVRGPESCSDPTTMDTSLHLSLDLADGQHFERTEVCLDGEPYRTLFSKIDGIRGKLLPD